MAQEIHNCLMEIRNDTIFDMTYVRDWYDCGRVADAFAWTDIAPGDHLLVLNEQDGFLSGCSGFVTYLMSGTEFSIAFCNSLNGTNKLGVGLDGQITWDEMSNHNYEEFVQGVDLGNGMLLVCYCQCTRGNMNSCVVELHFDLGARDCATPALLVGPGNELLTF